MLSDLYFFQYPQRTVTLVNGWLSGRETCNATTYTGFGKSITILSHLIQYGLIINNNLQ